MFSNSCLQSGNNNVNMLIRRQLRKMGAFLFLSEGILSGETVLWNLGVASNGSESANGSSFPITTNEIVRVHSTGLTTTVARLRANWGSVTASCLSDGDASGRTSSNGSAQSSGVLSDAISNSGSETVIVTFRVELEGESNRGVTAAIRSGSGSARSQFSISSNDPGTRHVSGPQAFQHVSVSGSLHILSFEPIVYEIDPGATLGINIDAVTAAGAGTGAFRDDDFNLITYESFGEGHAAARVWLESVTNLAGDTVTGVISSDSGHDYLAQPQPDSFNDWMSLYFLTTAGGAATDDSDGDGFDDLTEYYARTRPDRADSSPFPTLVFDASGQPSLEFPLLSRLAKYEVFRSETGLQSGDFQSLLEVSPAVTSGSENSISLPSSSAEKAFFRVEIGPQD